MATTNQSDPRASEDLEPEATHTVRVHPWRRFLARTIDLATGGFLTLVAVASLIALVLPAAAESFLESMENQIVFGLCLYTFWLPAEAVLLSTIGCTPAKWVFGIRVVTREEGRRLTVDEALRRTANVWLRGDGLGIPLAALITRLMSYRRLVNTGSTSWDDAVESVVLHARWGVLRAIGATVSVVFTLAWVVFLNQP